MSETGPKLEFQKADNRTYSTIPDSHFGTHIKEAISVIKDLMSPVAPKPQEVDFAHQRTL